VTDREIAAHRPRTSGDSPRISGETSKRSGVDRRQGLGRRIVRERRREKLSVDEERRSGNDRRSGIQRRVLPDRRSGGHKREPLGPIF